MTELLWLALIVITVLCLRVALVILLGKYTYWRFRTGKGRPWLMIERRWDYLLNIYTESQEKN